jgi:methylthioribose-1-phosphate isomerase
MKVFGKHYQTIWLDENDDKTIKIIDQRWLPHKFVIEEIRTFDEMCIAIKDMHLRGAGIIGVAACYGMYLATLEAQDIPNFDKNINTAAGQISATRPTAINLKWGVEKSLDCIKNAKTNKEKIEAAKSIALHVALEETETCMKIGQYGLELIEEIFTKKKGETVNILTHCNAGWLAFVDYGTALAPIYLAHKKGIKVHVWVDETRPRNQGASLTAWELGMEGVPHTLIVDNAGGHLMQNNMVDMVIVGTDRTTLEGVVVNKIGTYLKALAAKDNNIPFYVALPTSSIDWNTGTSIPIEKRSPGEVNYIWGLNDHNEISKVRITPENTKVLNYGFDITPSRLITKLITEKGIIDADLKSISKLKTK